MNREGVIGVNNQLPWHVPEDLQHFKQLTLDKPIVMGRKTFESIGRVLPKRTNIVITRDRAWSHAGVEVYHTFEDAIHAHNDVAELMIIGGGEIFKQALPLAHKLYITVVDIAITGIAVYFPSIDESIWQVVSSDAIVTQAGIHCVFKEYTKR